MDITNQLGNLTIVCNKRLLKKIPEFNIFYKKDYACWKLLLLKIVYINQLELIDRFSVLLVTNDIDILDEVNTYVKVVLDNSAKLISYYHKNLLLNDMKKKERKLY